MAAPPSLQFFFDISLARLLQANFVEFLITRAQSLFRLLVILSGGLYNTKEEERKLRHVIIIKSLSQLIYFEIYIFRYACSFF